MRGGCRAYRRSRDRPARVHACAPFASGVGRTLGSRNPRGGRTHGAPPTNADPRVRREFSNARKSLSRPVFPRKSWVGNRRRKRFYSNVARAF